MIFFFKWFFWQLHHSHLSIYIGELIISGIISTTVRKMLFSLLVCHREPFTYRETKFWIIQPAWMMEANFYLRSFQVGKDEDLFSSLQEAKHINVDWRKETHTTSVDIHVTRSSLIGFNKLNLLNVYSHDSLFFQIWHQQRKSRQEKNMTKQLKPAVMSA